MTYLTLMTTALGVVITAAAGAVCYLGGDTVWSRFGDLPGMDMLLAFPGTCLGLGSLLTVIGLVCQSSRID